MVGVNMVEISASAKCHAVYVWCFRVSITNVLVAAATPQEFFLSIQTFQIFIHV